ncbi:hypothetical protein ND00_25320 [Clostridium sp. L74]|nr:hypothetical protein ND00_25320 [Clostridium sp. L74]
MFIKINLIYVNMQMNFLKKFKIKNTCQNKKNSVYYRSCNVITAIIQEVAALTGNS